VPTQRAQEAAMKEINASIQAYIDRFPPETRRRLLAIRQIIAEIVPDAEEAIKYQMPTFVHHGNLIHYAAFKNHIGIYPLPRVIETLKDELKPYKQGKGSIQFQNDEELPIEIIKKIVRTRAEEKEREMR
jgi:uncharacterized protein YdhG (YjbR/CyaY superfamily)